MRVKTACFTIGKRNSQIHNGQTECETETQRTINQVSFVYVK